MGCSWPTSVQRLLPREDVVVLADHAYAPYARRPGVVVCDRVGHMVEALRQQYGCKLVVLASLQATLDSGAAVGAVGMSLAPAVARAAVATGGVVGVWVEPGSVRGPQLRAELRRARVQGAAGGDAARRRRSARPSWPRCAPRAFAAHCAAAASRRCASGRGGGCS